MIGNGLENEDAYVDGIIPLYRYLNDFYTGNMLGSFSKGFTFGESLTNGKARICGRTTSLLGIEKAIKEEEIIKSKKSKSSKCKLNKAKENIQFAIILLKKISKYGLNNQ